MPTCEQNEYIIYFYIKNGGYFILPFWESKGKYSLVFCIMFLWNHDLTNMSTSHTDPGIENNRKLQSRPYII